MKIAYLFHGHSRTWIDCYQSFFDNVYSILPGDIYIHTWDRVNSKYGSFWNGNLNLHNDYLESISSKTLDLDSIKRVYNPKHIIVETDRGIENVVKKYPQIACTGTNGANLAVYNMYLSQYKVFKLAESNETYDKYFSCRFDLEFTSRLNIEEFEHGEFLYTPPRHGGVNGSIFDIFSFGSHDIMSIKAEFYNHIWDYWYSKQNVFPAPEQAVTKYYSDFEIKTKDVSLSYSIKRLF